MTPPRLVLDTNVLLTALLFPAGTASWLRTAWQAGRVQPLVSRETATELLRVLTYPKFGLSAEERQDLLDDYLPCCEAVAVPDPPPAVPQCRDPFDVPFLELALAARADALITGDADLLAPADSFAVPILSPAALKKQLVQA